MDNGKTIFDHVALEVNDINGTVDLFRDVFGFSIEKYAGNLDCPQKVWFRENLQLNKTDSVIVKKGGFFNHLALKVSNKDKVIEDLLKHSGKQTSDGPNWILMPDGLYFEIL